MIYYTVLYYRPPRAARRRGSIARPGTGAPGAPGARSPIGYAPRPALAMPPHAPDGPRGGVS